MIGMIGRLALPKKCLSMFLLMRMLPKNMGTWALSTSSSSAPGKAPSSRQRSKTTNVLVLSHSLSGETAAVVQDFVKGLERSSSSSSSINIDQCAIQMDPPLAFPWSFWDFFDVMPEALHPQLVERWKKKKSMVVVPPPQEIIDKSNTDKYDLVILGWQTWFLSPSLPVRLALRSPAYQELLANQQVLLLGTHRNMWHTASATLQRELQGGSSNSSSSSVNLVGVTVVGRVDYVQQSPFLASVVNTLRWQLGGSKGTAGVKETAQAVEAGEEFGALFAKSNKLATTSTWYEAGAPHKSPVAAVEHFWRPVKTSVGALMGCFPPGSLVRKAIIVVYVPCLILAILVIGVPIIVGGSFLERIIGK